MSLTVLYVDVVVTNIYIEINIDNLIKLHKEYPWPTIDKCPCCHCHRLWGHGYSYRYLEGYLQPFPMKRYRCPYCHSVFITRPKTHYRRFLVNIESIIACLITILQTGKKSEEYSRQRQHYWIKGFLIQASRYSNPVMSLELLENLKQKDIIFPTHSLKYFEIITAWYLPHLSFSFTKAHDSG